MEKLKLPPQSTTNLGEAVARTIRERKDRGNDPLVVRRCLRKRKRKRKKEREEKAEEDGGDGEVYMKREEDVYY